jgi:hypothetical protein
MDLDGPTALMLAATAIGYWLAIGDRRNQKHLVAEAREALDEAETDLLAAELELNALIGEDANEATPAADCNAASLLPHLDRYAPPSSGGNEAPGADRGEAATPEHHQDPHRPG